MIRTLLTRRWVTALLVATIFAVACFFLGRWQWGRYEYKAHRAHQVTTYYSSTPVSLESVLPAATSPLPADELWRRVQVRGAYQPTQLFVRNRPQNIVYGYEILAPLRLADGSALVVDRGWVPNAERADILPKVPAPPAGSVLVTGWLRPGEETLNSDLPRGQLASIDLGQAAAQTGLRVRPAYLVLDREDDGSGTPPPRPQALLAPDTGTGPHLAYALQWWLACPVGFVLVWVYARREWRDSAAGSAVTAQRQARQAQRQAAAESGGAGGQGRRARSKADRPPKPKKVRIWDEEDA